MAAGGGVVYRKPLALAVSPAPDCRDLPVPLGSVRRRAEAASFPLPLPAKPRKPPAPWHHPAVSSRDPPGQHPAPTSPHRIPPIPPRDADPTCPSQGHKAKRLLLGMGLGFGAKPGVGFAPGGHKPWPQSPDRLGASAVPGGPGSRQATRALTRQSLPAPAPLLGGHSPRETSRNPSPSHPIPTGITQLELAPPRSRVPPRGGRCPPGPPWHGGVAAGAWRQLRRALRFHSPGTVPAWDAAQPESPVPPLCPPSLRHLPDNCPPAAPACPCCHRLPPCSAAAVPKSSFLTQILQPLSLELPRVRRVLPAAGTGTLGVMALVCPPPQGETEAGVPGAGAGRAWHVGQKKGAFVWGGLGVRGGSGPLSRPAGASAMPGMQQECGAPAPPTCQNRAPRKLGMGISQGGNLGGSSTPTVEGLVTPVVSLPATGAPTR